MNDQGTLEIIHFLIQFVFLLFNCFATLNLNFELLSEKHLNLEKLLKEASC